MDEALIRCPYCGEENELFIDEGGAREQFYVEDCQVCCRPMQVSIHATDDGETSVFVDRADYIRLDLDYGRA